MSAYTALDKIVLFHEKNCTFSACVGHEARSELAALRARVAELEQRRTFDAGVIDGLNVAIKIKDDRIDELEAAQSATLTPRKCVTCNPLAPKPQSQASLSEQLRELVQLANANGLYDAADYIRRED